MPDKSNVSLYANQAAKNFHQWKKDQAFKQQKPAGKILTDDEEEALSKKTGSKKSIPVNGGTLNKPYEKSYREKGLDALSKVAHFSMRPGDYGQSEGINPLVVPIAAALPQTLVPNAALNLMRPDKYYENDDKLTGSAKLALDALFVTPGAGILRGASPFAKWNIPEKGMNGIDAAKTLLKKGYDKSPYIPIVGGAAVGALTTGVGPAIYEDKNDLNYNRSGDFYEDADARAKQVLERMIPGALLGAALAGRGVSGWAKDEIRFNKKWRDDNLGGNNPGGGGNPVIPKKPIISPEIYNGRYEDDLSRNLKKMINSDERQKIISDEMSQRAGVKEQTLQAILKDNPGFKRFSLEKFPGITLKSEQYAKNNIASSYNPFSRYGYANMDDQKLHDEFLLWIQENQNATDKFTKAISLNKNGGVVPYGDGGKVKPDSLINNYPKLKKLGDITLKSDTTFTRDKTDMGDIEYFSPNQDTVRYSKSYKYPHPKMGTHGIVYNPKTNNEESIALDLLHGMASADPVYNYMRNKFKDATLKQSERTEHWFNEDVKKYGEGDGKESWINNYVDGLIRSEVSNDKVGGYALDRTENSDDMHRIGKQIKNYVSSSGEGYMLPEATVKPKFTAAGYPMIGGKKVPKGYINQGTPTFGDGGKVNTLYKSPFLNNPEVNEPHADLRLKDVKQLSPELQSLYATWGLGFNNYVGNMPGQSLIDNGLLNQSGYGLYSKPNYKFERNNQPVSIDIPRVRYIEPPTNLGDYPKNNINSFDHGGEIEMSRSDFEDEHRELLKVLRSGNPKLLKKEYNEQKEEMNSHGIYNQGGSIGQNMLQYGTMGATMGSVAGPYGTAIGAGVGAIGGLAKGIIDNRNNQLAMNAEQDAYQQMMNKFYQSTSPYMQEGGSIQRRTMSPAELQSFMQPQTGYINPAAGNHEKVTTQTPGAVIIPDSHTKKFEKAAAKAGVPVKSTVPLNNGSQPILAQGSNSSGKPKEIVVQPHDVAKVEAVTGKDVVKTFAPNSKAAREQKLRPGINDILPSDFQSIVNEKRSNPNWKNYNSNYYVYSKENSTFYVMNNKHEIIDSMFAGRGRQKGDWVNTVDMSKASSQSRSQMTTPGGSGTINGPWDSADIRKRYGTPLWNVVYNDKSLNYVAEDGSINGLHGIWPENYNERIAMLENPDIKEKLMSYGCINVPASIIMQPENTPQHGDSIFISKEPEYYKNLNQMKQQPIAKKFGAGGPIDYMDQIMQAINYQRQAQGNPRIMQYEDFADPNDWNRNKQLAFSPSQPVQSFPNLAPERSAWDTEIPYPAENSKNRNDYLFSSLIPKAKFDNSNPLPYQVGTPVQPALPSNFDLPDPDPMAPNETFDMPAQNPSVQLPTASVPSSLYNRFNPAPGKSSYASFADVKRTPDVKPFNIFEDYLSKANTANNVATGIGTGMEVISLINNLTRKYEPAPTPARTIPKLSFTDFEGRRLAGQKGIDRSLQTALRAGKESNMNETGQRAVVGAMEAYQTNNLQTDVMKQTEANQNRGAFADAINDTNKSLFQAKAMDWQARSQFSDKKGDAIANNLSNFSTIAGQYAGSKMKLAALSGGNDIMALKAEYFSTTDPKRKQELHDIISHYGFKTQYRFKPQYRKSNQQTDLYENI